MHCRTCGYALWNLSEPRCPECGTAFDLREYRFKPGTVAFGCPFCGALHEGAGEAYLPSQTDVATCQGCGQAMQVAQMRVVLLSDDPEAAAINAVPWQDRRRIGTWRAWWATCRMGMVAPTTLARRIQSDTPWTEAYWFAAITHGVGVLAHAVLGLVIWLIILAMMAIGGANSQNMAIAGWTGAFIVLGLMVMTVMAALLAPLMIAAFSGGAAHLFLRITGPTKAGLNTTLAATLYAQGPMVLQVIPICGFYLSSFWQIWTLVVAILTLKDAQAVSGVRATFAYLWLWILLFIVYVGVIAILAATGVLE